MARFIPPSAIRPLIDANGGLTDQSREYFNLTSKLSIEVDGNPNGSVEPLFIGQMAVDVTTAPASRHAYINVDLTNTGWRQIT